MPKPCGNRAFEDFVHLDPNSKVSAKREDSNFKGLVAPRAGLEPPRQCEAN